MISGSPKRANNCASFIGNLARNSVLQGGEVSESARRALPAEI